MCKHVIQLQVNYYVTFDHVAHRAHYVLDLVVCEQIGDFAGREQVVDEHEEALVGDLCVAHQEHHTDALEAAL